jgi:flagellar capping protein FliD
MSLEGIKVYLNPNGNELCLLSDAQAEIDKQQDSCVKTVILHKKKIKSLEKQVEGQYNGLINVLVKCKAETEHLNQEGRNEYFDLAIKKIESIKQKS